MGTKQIALQLQAEKRVGVEYHKKIRKGIAVTAENIYLWNSGTIAAILKRQEYVGDTVNFRTQIASYKNKTVIYNGSDKIKIFPDTHPAIISRELFQMAQDRCEKTIRHPSRPHKYLFGDYLYCMDCHARMHGRRCGTKSENALYCYECTTYRKSKGCYFHGVPEKYLEAEILQAIQRVIYKANANPDEFYKTIQKRVEKKSDDCKAVVLAEFEKSQLRITEIDKYIQGLFEAKVRGEIDGSLFASLKRTYDEEKEQLNALVAELIGKLHEKNESVNKVKLFMQAIKKYDAVMELTPQVLADFLKAYNQLLTDKGSVLSLCEMLLRAFSDCSDLDAKMSVLDDEEKQITKNIREMVVINSRTVQKQPEYTLEYQSYEREYEALKAKYQKLQAEKLDRINKTTVIQDFMGQIKKRKELIKVFSSDVWLAAIETVTIGKKGELQFRFKNGTEITV